MKTTMILLVAALMLAGCEACHNSTSACHHNGKFECLDGSMVTHAQRCDGVEDCKDGMDEFMCPRTAPGHHEVHEEASCGSISEACSIPAQKEMILARIICDNEVLRYAWPKRPLRVMITRRYPRRLA